MRIVPIVISLVSITISGFAIGYAYTGKEIAMKRIPWPRKHETQKTPLGVRILVTSHDRVVLDTTSSILAMMAQYSHGGCLNVGILAVADDRDPDNRPTVMITEDPTAPADLTVSVTPCPAAALPHVRSDR
jgi:hypothetical protein